MERTIWLAVDKDGVEMIFSKKPERGVFRWCVYVSFVPQIPVPKGTIKKLIGRELTWADEPMEYKG